MALVMHVYRNTEKFPSTEADGLTSQIRRAAVSIPSNITEGAARRTNKEFTNFLYIARGSLSELDTQIELANRLGYLNDNDENYFNELMEQIDKMLTGLIRHLGKSEE